MDPELRRRFNEAFTPALHERLVERVTALAGRAPDYRLAESPTFFPPELRDRCARDARAILELAARPELVERLRRAVPPERLAPGGEELPACALVDLAIARGASGALEPRLIEMQGFPSLFAYTLLHFDAWAGLLAGLPGMPARWDAFFGGLDRDGVLRRFRRAIVGDHDPLEVALVDLDPATQKTAIDFEATRKLLGVESVCLTKLERDPATGRLFRRRENGARVRVRRIYNRVVFDEIEKKGAAFPFDLREPLDVEWAPHPAWYWIWSKAALPWLRHPSVPAATLVSDWRGTPEELRRRVLKPLFSFAGGGVKLDPTPQDLAAIPEPQRSGWVLQERIVYEPALQAADGGGVKVEVRMMFFRDPAEAVPRLAMQLTRLSRGAMLGVDFNKDFTWVGSSLGMWPA
jgi:hypothetical protein